MTCARANQSGAQRASAVAWALGTGLFLLCGCGAVATTQGRIDGLKDVIAQAEQQGARACAPRQLAVARAHLEFADAELAQGHISRAEEHLRLAEPSAQAALTQSPQDRCGETPPVQDTDRDGILDPNDRCPEVPEDHDGVEDEDGCPEEEDTDGDGLSDARDLCPLQPEDVDSYQDEDGCPEPDNDLDGIADVDDRCPTAPEDADSFEDADGCPDEDNDRDSVLDVDDMCPNEPGLPPAAVQAIADPADRPETGCPRVYRDVEVTTEAIRIRQTIYFRVNKATIRPVSFPILDTVTQVLTDYPDIKVEVQGHTDSQGNDAHNLDLSQRRAESVREYLVSRGVSADRLRPKGYGESAPIESNRTRAGRAANRRVEFIRFDAGAPGPEGETSTDDVGQGEGAPRRDTAGSAAGPATADPVTNGTSTTNGASTQ